MTVHCAYIDSEVGPFVFIRLSDTIEQTRQDIQGWARQLSSEYFSGLPVVVHNHAKDNREILTTFPPEFQSHSVIGNMTGADSQVCRLRISSNGT